MTNLNEKLQPVDIIAMLIIVGCFIMLILTLDESPTAITTLATITGFYFGRMSKR